jgi:hypothetical protein
VAGADLPDYGAYDFSGGLAVNWLRSIAREVLGLFVDDGSFAIAILVWAAFVGALLEHAVGHPNWTGPALFSGLACILIESVVRFSRRRSK